MARLGKYSMIHTKLANLVFLRENGRASHAGFSIVYSCIEQHRAKVVAYFRVGLYTYPKVLGT